MLSLYFRAFSKYIFGGLMFVVLMLGLGLWMERRHSAKLEAQIAKCEAARHADREAYAKAQADAQAQNKAQVAHVEQQQQKVTDDVTNAYRSDLARLRADNARLRSQATGAAQGAADKPGASPVSEGAAGTPPEVVSLPPAELLRAQELELQLNALIDWLLKQSEVDPNK